MPDGLAVVLTWVGCLAVLAMLFPGGRKLLGAVWGQAWMLLKWAGEVFANSAQKLAARIFRAHVNVIRNFLPRQAVLPSVGKPTARRE
jgi:hypothetical protein